MRKKLLGAVAASWLLFAARNNYAAFIKRREKVKSTFKTVNTPYGDIAYLDIGDKSKPVILFSGGGGAGIDLIYAFDWLLENEYRVISINRPGYYGLKIKEDDSIRQHADIYHEVIKALDIEEVSVFGLSMGGLSALYYAESYPVTSLVLWSAVTGPYQPNKEATDSAAGKLMMTDNGKDILSWLMFKTAHDYPSLLMKELLKAEAHMETNEIKHMLNYMKNNKSATRQFKQFIESLTPMSAFYPGMMNELDKAAKPDPINWQQIDCPVLSVHSSSDKDVNYAHLLRIKEKLPQSETMTVKAGGHFVWWGKEGNEVVKKTDCFLKNINASERKR